MGMIAPLDSAFLIQEARASMHVAGLQLFRLPAGTDEDYVGDLYRQLLTYTDVSPLFSRRPRDPVESVGNFWWKTEADIDIEYHVRRSALPVPGGFVSCSNWSRGSTAACWTGTGRYGEYHVIEGLPDRRFATYAKCHHALADGITLTRKVLRVVHC